MSETQMMEKMEKEEFEKGDLSANKACAKEKNYLTKNISTNLGVEYILTASCFLKSSSPDQIAEPRYKASAKYGTSLACGANFSALDCISSGKLTIGNISILSLRISNISITSDSALPHISAIVPIFLVNSSIRYEDATKLNLSSKNNLNVLPLPIIAANNTVASTTNSIYASRNLFATDLEILSVNSLATLSETLTLDENCLSFFNFSALSNIAFLATSGQSSLNSCILLSNSSGTFIDMVGISSSPNGDGGNDYLNVLKNNFSNPKKSFGFLGRKKSQSDFFVRQKPSVSEVTDLKRGGVR